MKPEIYGIVGTLLGVFVGAPVTYWFSIKYFNRQRKLEAAAAFRESFLDELILSKTFAKESDSKQIIDVLTQELPKHNKAIIRYRPYVEKSKLESFDKACAIFTSYEERLTVRFAKISGITQEIDIQGLTENQVRGKVKAKIEHMFKYAPTN